MVVKKCPSSIWCRDLNLQPLACESLPITTRPGLPPQKIEMFVSGCIHETRYNLRPVPTFLRDANEPSSLAVTRCIQETQNQT